jgi:hypothetical protein
MGFLALVALRDVYLRGEEVQALAIPSKMGTMNRTFP